MKDPLGLRQPAHVVSLIKAGFRTRYLFLFAIPVISRLLLIGFGLWILKRMRILERRRRT